MQVTPRPRCPSRFEATRHPGGAGAARRSKARRCPGHSVTNVSVTPSQVRIEGPESAVGSLTEVSTEPVSVERATTWCARP